MMALIYHAQYYIPGVCVGGGGEYPTLLYPSLVAITQGYDLYTNIYVRKISLHNLTMLRLSC